MSRIGPIRTPPALDRWAILGSLVGQDVADEILARADRAARIDRDDLPRRFRASYAVCQYCRCLIDTNCHTHCSKCDAPVREL